ncbi:MAG: hypothetical protein ACTHJR_00750 [Sphingomonas sp.]|uniref:hypothetical protein n=1 Tax=Sphingomonas sp. TaxID=28214 RepID=UPI003F7E200D
MVDGGRDVRMSVATREIETTIDLGRVASAANGGGLIGVIIIEATDDRRDTMRRTLRAKADATAASVRQALADVDVDALAASATRAAMAKTAWLEARDVDAIGGASGAGGCDGVAPAGAPQCVSIVYRYQLSPDFSQIRVIADVTIVRRPQARGANAASDPTLYRQRLASIVRLRSPSYEPRENADRWSENHGSRARAALAAAFGRFEQMIPYALDLSSKDIEGFGKKDREKIFAAGFNGTLIARNASDPDDVLLWSDGLIQVQAVS